MKVFILFCVASCLLLMAVWTVLQLTVFRKPMLEYFKKKSRWLYYCDVLVRAVVALFLVGALVLALTLAFSHKGGRFLRGLADDIREDSEVVVGGDFSQFIDFLEYDGPVGDSLMMQDYKTLIAQWDALQSGHSEVLEAKKVIGYATAATKGVAVPDTSRPIYEYVLKPIPHNSTGYEEYVVADPGNTVKVLIATGVHGSEKPASTAVLELVKHLVGYYASSRYDGRLISIAQNCEFHIIPCVNPYGYGIPYTSKDPSPRNNARGVNINRNMGYKWDKQKGLDTKQNGQSAYSECESQAVAKWIASNRDAYIYVDAHTSYMSNSPLQGCFSYPYDGCSKMLLHSYLKEVSIRAQRQWPSIFTENQYIGFIGSSGIPPAARLQRLLGVSVKGSTNISTTSSEAHYINSIPHAATLEVNTNAGLRGRGDEQQVVLSLNQTINYIRLCLSVM